MAKFIKSGSRVFKKAQGIDYDLIPGCIYTLEVDRWGDDVFRETGELNMPEKVYQTAEDEAFVKQILTTFDKNVAGNLGVLLCGEKGTGKTIMVKHVAAKSNLPIVIVDEEYPTVQLLKFFKDFDSDVCIIIDEVEKNHNTQRMLGFLDGVHKTCKKLVLMTCNNINDVSEYFINRPSRVRYTKDYTMKGNLVYFDLLLEDLQTSEENKKILKDYVLDEITHTSFDILQTLLQELEIQGVDLNGNLTKEMLKNIFENINVR